MSLSFSADVCKRLAHALMQEWFSRLVSERLTLCTWANSEGGQAEHMETSILLASESLRQLAMTSSALCRGFAPHLPAALQALLTVLRILRP